MCFVTVVSVMQNGLVQVQSLAGLAEDRILSSFCVGSFLMVKLIRG